jgi:urease accessory protein UreF
MPSDSDMMNRQGSRDEGDVAQRAYRRFETRGFEHGHDMDDWLEAEREAREERSRTTGGSE